MSATDEAPEGVIRVRAENPSPLTLDGTNTYVVGRWVVDPGPEDPGHLERVLAAAGGELDGIVLTHGHADHAEGAESLAARAGFDGVVTRPGEGERIGPFEAMATPGHAPEHVCLILDTHVCFTGDTVLGEGSVFVAPGEGAAGQSSLGAYLDSLRRLRALDLRVLCPGHGPFVHDPLARLDQYLEHRLSRERALLEALEAGARSEDELLEAAWGDVPRALRGAAALTLAAHLEKLREERRVPAELAGVRSTSGGSARRARAADYPRTR